MAYSKNRNYDRSEKSLKSAAMKKVSGLLVAMLLISALTPLLAFAGIFYGDDIQYKDNTVSGSVYTDVYSVNNSVYVNVYDKDKNYIGFVEAVYDKTVNGATYYKFNQTLTSVYDAVYFSAYYKAGVSGAVYADTYSNLYTRTTSPVYVGGYFPGSSNGTLDAYNGVISESALKDALAKNKDVTINLKNSETLQIPAAALVGAKEGATLTIVGENGTYVLPLSVLKLEDLAKQLGVELKDLKINVEIKKVTGTVATAVYNAIQGLGGKALSNAVDFNVTAEGKDGKKIAVDFGKTYVKRIINLSKAPTGTATVALYNPATKALSFVPSKVAEKSADFWRTGNSIYVAVEKSASFNDVDSDFWAKADIELLASKLVVDGTGAGKFEPERNITRAEFAALAVKALGLSVSSVVYNTYFTDVATTDWSAGVIAAAKAAGLVDGYEDGSFKPQQEITREELAALVVRALKFAGVDTSVTSAEQAQLLAKFSDADSIVWAEKEVAAAIKAGIVNGITDTTLATDESATRAQSAAMLKRLLSKAGFIE